MVYTAAIVLTVVAWAVQLHKTAIKKERNISPVLPLLYAIACVLFVISNLMANKAIDGILDIVCVVLAATVFVLLLTKRKAG